MIYIVLSKLHLIYLVLYKPYEEPALNRSEIFNEICVLLTGYQLIVYSDFVKSEKMKSSFGYWMIGTVIFNFGVNILQ
jgi:hypothetical protein